MSLIRDANTIIVRRSSYFFARLTLLISKKYYKLLNYIYLLLLKYSLLLKTEKLRSKKRLGSIISLKIIYLEYSLLPRRARREFKPFSRALLFDHLFKTSLEHLVRGVNYEYQHE